MQKLLEFWNERSSRQKVTLGWVFLAAFLTVSAFSWIASRPSMSVLYSGLDSSAAGEVIAGIDRLGVTYEVQGNTIYVESAQRDRLRMNLAAQGLPAGGSTGYELLDGMSGFSTTSQMFDAAYWRAKEGELARTILALPNVQSARVHLSNNQNRGHRNTTMPTASVTVTTGGNAINRSQAKSLKYLISSAVPGLQPDAVSVIDSERGVIAAERDATRQERALEMKRNVERILEPHVGQGNVIVELNLDLVTEKEQLTEQRFDPQERAMISQLVEESSDQSSMAGASAVTAASNLPDNSNTNSEPSQSARSENRQQSNYEVSQSLREVTRQPGAVKRMSVAVLVNGEMRKGSSGAMQLVPRNETELETLRELVASAVGFDAARGDQITVKSLPFVQIGADGTLATRGDWLDRIELNALAKLALIGLFALAVAVTILRPVLRNRQSAQPNQRLLDNSTAPLGEDAPIGALANTATIEPPVRQVTNSSTLIGSDAPGTAQLSLPPADPVARLRGMMKERQTESLKILSGWIDKKEEAH